MWWRWMTRSQYSVTFLWCKVERWSYRHGKIASIIWINRGTQQPTTEPNLTSRWCLVLIEINNDNWLLFQVKSLNVIKHVTIFLINIFIHTSTILIQLNNHDSYWYYYWYCCLTKLIVVFGLFPPCLFGCCHRSPSWFQISTGLCLAVFCAGGCTHYHGEGRESHKPMATVVCTLGSYFNYAH